MTRGTKVLGHKKKDLWQITIKPVDLSKTGPVPVDAGPSPVFLSHYGWMMDHGFSLGKVPEATLEMKVHIRN